MDLRLNLPSRNQKPRQQGLNILIDSGTPRGRFEDIVTSFGEHIDFIKFGWCTGYLSRCLPDKIQVAAQNGIECFLGGTFFEKCLLQNRLDEYCRFCESLGCTYIEVSNGTIDLTNERKAAYIARLAKDFRVFSEVGYKDCARSLELHPARWVEYIQQDLQAGAEKVITEARESGKSGICRENGELRFGLINEILCSPIDIEHVIFEAPTRSMQVYFIRRLGSNVNLANLPIDEVIGVETLRLGLRGDTLLDFEPAEASGPRRIAA